jgi:hypothetical protein
MNPFLGIQNMAIVYVKLHQPLHPHWQPSGNFFGACGEIEYLKSSAPDDGEAMAQADRFCVACADDAWKDVIEILDQSGLSLVYSVVLHKPSGEAVVRESGELNTDVSHYTTRGSDSKQIFAFWFGECLPSARQARWAA